MNETKRAILEAIADGPVSGPAIADSLSVSRAAIWKAVEELRAAGFAIETDASGYVLKGVEGYSGPAVEFGLEAPFSVEFHERIQSTNDRARALATDGESDVVVLADEQTGGRGRLNREWFGPRGGIWMSVVCRPTIEPARAPVYTLAGAVATASAAREAGVDARIKWPNDVIVPQEGDSWRKLAGILTEMKGETDRIDWLVVGIGVNANVDADELPETATSIRALVGDVDRTAFVKRVLEQFERGRTDLDRTLSDWRSLTDTIGRRVRIRRGNETIVGTAIDVTEFGSLVVETDGGTETITSGDCEHLRRVREESPK